MKYPEFFDLVPKINLYDPLAEFLGASEKGVLQYGYLDAVLLAGHSCPTVASAYWSTRKALAFLYPDTIPVRGEIKVEFSDGITSGVTGVIANVVSMLTGAMSDNGFKGIGGHFDRREHLFFSVEMQGEMRFTRLDTNRAVRVAQTCKAFPLHRAYPALWQAASGILQVRKKPPNFASFGRNGCAAFCWSTAMIRRFLL